VTRDPAVAVAIAARYRLVAHPIQDRTDDELRALARGVARQLVDAVTA
jgi:hypothetical protein